MSSIYTIMQRQSVRRFKDQAVPLEDIKTMLNAAAHAPSAKNIQNWHYVVVTNQEKLLALAKTLEKKNEELAQQIQDEKSQVRFRKFLRFGIFFKEAPAVIFAFTKDDYIPTGLAELQAMQAPEEAINQLERTNPALQSIGASIQNLILAATELGYGSCWMTSPNYAANEISDALDFHRDGYHLVATIPLGIIEGTPKSPPRKSMEEYTTFID